MQEPYPKELGLAYKEKVESDANNCTFWKDIELLVAFLEEGVLCMVSFPFVFLYGHRSTVPESLDDLIIAINTPDTLMSILNDKPTLGVLHALRALENKKFQTNYGKHIYGSPKSVFKKDFKAIATKRPLITDIFVREKNCSRNSMNEQKC